MLAQPSAPLHRPDQSCSAPPGGGYAPPPGGGYAPPPGGGFGAPPGGTPPPGGGFGSMPPSGAPPGGGFGAPPGGGFGAPQGGGYAPGPAMPPPSSQEQTVRSKAKWGLILALIGFPLCCFPLSIVGGVFGFSAMKLAKANNLPTPGSAIFAIVLAALTLLSSAGVGVGGYLNHRATEERLAGLSEKLEGKRADETLERDIACLLAEERVVDHGFAGETNDPEGFDCTKAEFKTEGQTAELRGVRFEILSDEHTATACYARGARWFVIKMTRDGECGTIHPPKPSDAKGLSQEQLRKMEDEARSHQVAREAQALVDMATASLTKIRADAAKVPEQDLQACDDDVIQKFLGSRSKLTVPTVDYARLDAKKGKKDDHWSFLTSDEVVTLLGDAKTADKREAIQEMRDEGGKLLLVYRSVDRFWPKIHVDKGFIGDDFSFDGGEYAGFMLLYDLTTGKRLCHGSIVATNSETVRFREGRFSSKEAKARKAVVEDFKDNLKDAAVKQIRKMHGKLKLGYKLLE